MNLSPDSHSATDVIRLLALEPLPHEGGWFRRTDEAATFTRDGRRAWSTALALFTADAFSALHRLAVDEVWCHQAGDPLDMLCLSLEGQGVQRTLGGDPASGGATQIAVAAGTWQGARLVDGGQWALVTCVVVPEFRWDDFQLGDRSSLEVAYPLWAGMIRRLTRA